jgi:hypothetical protein
MAANLRRFARWMSWLLPHGVHVARQRWLAHARPMPSHVLPAEALATNATLRARHAGQRCFILGNGPSAKALDLAALRGQTVISVSNGYLHRDYVAIAPRYHCVPQITYERMTPADVVTWFHEMHAQLGSAELFLNETEAELVREHGLFEGRKVHYLAFRESFDEIGSTELIDLSGPIPGVESVPVMALMIAMYLGFNHIALLGVDHDHFRSRSYSYAFELGVQAGKDFSVSEGGRVQTPWHDEFQSLARLWRQYRVLKQIASANGITVVNATPGGELDEFPRVPFAAYLEGGT